MKQYILLLVLMVMGAGIHAYAEDVNPVKEGNVISGHVVEKGTENSLPYSAGTRQERMLSQIFPLRQKKVRQ